MSYLQKYNTSLETLDMSKNPCCGPGLEGVSWVPTKSITITANQILDTSTTNCVHTQQRLKEAVLVVDRNDFSGWHMSRRVLAGIEFTITP